MPEIETLDLELHSIGGGYRSLTEFLGRRILLIFLQFDCPHSQRLLPAVAGLAPNPSGGTPAPIIISTGPYRAIRDQARALDIRCPVFIQDDDEASIRFSIYGTPSASLFDEHGLMLGRAVTGAASVLALAGIMPGPDWTSAATKMRGAGDYLFALLEAQASRGDPMRVEPRDLKSTPGARTG